MESSLSSCGHTCTDLGILIFGKVEEKKELKNVLNSPLICHEDHETFTYVKNEK